METGNLDGMPTGRSVFRIPTGTKSSVFQNAKTDCGEQPAPAKRYGRFYPRGHEKISTHLPLVSRLKMSGTISLRPVCLHGADRNDLTFQCVCAHW
jgi:hypothetical protein